MTLGALALVLDRLSCRVRVVWVLRVVVWVSCRVWV